MGSLNEKRGQLAHSAYSRWVRTNEWYSEGDRVVVKTLASELVVSSLPL